MNERLKILVIEDEPVIANALRKSLELEGYEASVVHDGLKAEVLLQQHVFHLLLLDWRLPGKSGIDLCRSLRTSGNFTPILMLTVLDHTAEKVEALRAGADDYVTKPFSTDEILARVSALLRRSSGAARELTFGDLFLNPLTHSVTCNGKSVKLPEKEFTLLAYLAMHKSEVVSRDVLHVQVWNIPYTPSSNLVDVTIKNLRKHLAEVTPVKCIKSIYGEGYAFTTT